MSGRAEAFIEDVRIVNVFRFVRWHEAHPPQPEVGVRAEERAVQLLERRLGGQAVRGVTYMDFVIGVVLISE